MATAPAPGICGVYDQIEPDSTSYWHVRARNHDGTSGWSDTWSFTIGPAENPCLVSTALQLDNNEVNTLRGFRDEVLSPVGLGRLFIKLYYRLSPGFVNRFGRFRFVHRVIRYGLDRIIRRLV